MTPPATPVRRERRSLLVLAGVAALGVLPWAGCGGGGSSLSNPPNDFPAGVVRGPMLALPSPTSTTIAWTSVEPVVGTVEFGPDTGYGAAVADASATLDHALALTGLTPGATVHYRILDGGVPAGGDHAFTVPAADPAAPLRFAVIGDTGTGGAAEFAAIARLEAEAPDLVVHVGDLAYDAGTVKDVFERFTLPFEHVMDHRPLFAALGNHDVDTENGRPFLDAVVLPTNPVDGSERFYAFDFGPCRFAALDSNGDLSASSPQVTWLASDLGASSATWKFVFFHHPVWSSSRHGSRPDLQASLAPTLEAAHVDVVWSGHDHDYERTFPIVGTSAFPSGDPDYVDPPGPIYVVSGGGGQTLYPNGTSAFTATSASAFHVTVVDVVGSTLTITAVGLDGTVIDRATIAK